MPNEPAWPARPEPSSYAHTGVGGRSGCSLRRISRWVKEYRPGPLGLATTMPSPGTGSGWRNLRRPLPADPGPPPLKVARPRRAAGIASTAPVATPYCRNRLRVVSVMISTCLRADCHCLACGRARYGQVPGRAGGPGAGPPAEAGWERLCLVACRRGVDRARLGISVATVARAVRPGPPDEPVHRNQPRDVAQTGDERDGEQQQGGDAGQIDRPDVHVGRVAVRGHVVPELEQPQ